MYIQALVALLFLCVLASASNLPDLPPGVFSVQTSIEIRAPMKTVWDSILDFTEYPDWNPFVRSQIVTNAVGVPLDSQIAQENLRVIIQVQIPPLTAPVNASTPPNPLHAQTSFENITHIDVAQWRVAWKSIMLPQALLNAERWQALSPTADGRTLYESKEVYEGPLSYIVDPLFKAGLQEGFEAMASALKARVEG